ncbi:MAG: methionyl-tRNA formyltransferase [Shewanellaceae bacterium]|nr:methionyl-tRNA formyltransferase [Shewanellaceae bacterium]
MKSYRILFAGTPDFAARHLTSLLNSHHDVVAVYTKPDKPAGRGQRLQESPVKQLALAAHIPVFQPKTLRDTEVQAQLKAHQADLMVVVAYGLILPQAVLDIPELGCLNVHGSLLPKWRGAAPIQRSIWAGDRETGVTIMQMDEGIDTGDILYTASCDITEQDTSATLYEKLAQLGCTALLDALLSMGQGQLQPKPQDHAQATHAHKLTKAEAQLDFTKSATELHQEIRAFDPWPNSYFIHKQQAIKVKLASVVPENDSRPCGEIIRCDAQGLLISTGQGSLLLEKIQMPNKRSLPVQDIINAHPNWFQLGTSLISSS